MSTVKMSERAILMRFSVGMPGKSRKDKNLTKQVQGQHALGKESGGWVKNRFPKWALEPLEKVAGQARTYHDAITLTFDAGIGILPSALVMEYREKMGEFCSRFESLVQSHFVPKYEEMIDWAKYAQNGTFDQSDYPAVDELLASFTFRVEPMPVPESSHFTATMSSLLGVDSLSVDQRIADVALEAQREVLRRLIEPVRKLAEKLVEAPKNGKLDIVYRDSLIGNILEIADLAPKLNIADDPAINAFAKEIRSLARFEPDILRESKGTRQTIADEAAATLKRLEAYKI
jgi:hypothetical protein